MCNSCQIAHRKARPFSFAWQAKDISQKMVKEVENLKSHNRRARLLLRPFLFPFYILLNPENRIVLSIDFATKYCF